MAEIDKIIEELQKILKKYCKCENINKNTIIFDKKNRLLDSLEITNFICEIEKKFVIEDLIYEDITLDNFKTVYTLAKFILKLKEKEKNE